MYDKLFQYQPINEQEETDLLAIKQFLKRNPDILERSNLVAHMTTSAFIMNEEMDHVLFIYHNIYDSWGWVGGHNDGDSDCLHVAIKEAKEETGLEEIRPFDDEILGVDVILVTNHQKNGKYVPDHLHLNVTYLLIADMEHEVKIKPDENSGVRWFSIEEVFDYVDEERMKPLYRKLIEQARKRKK